MATVGVVAIDTELGNLEHQALVMDQDGAMCLAVIGIAAEGKFQVLDGHVGRDVHVMDGDFGIGARNHAQLANNEVTHRTTGNVCLVLALVDFGKKANALPDGLRNVLFFNLHVPNVAKRLPYGNLHAHCRGDIFPGRGGAGIHHSIECPSSPVRSSRHLSDRVTICCDSVT